MGRELHMAVAAEHASLLLSHAPLDPGFSPPLVTVASILWSDPHQSPSIPPVRACDTFGTTYPVNVLLKCVWVVGRWPNAVPPLWLPSGWLATELLSCSVSCCHGPSPLLPGSAESSAQGTQHVLITLQQ